ncbi:hypothetical protein NPIL_373431 [Nephila pilipes]|uniref:Uncharacterized protein n=1 Tax=Nephila pilipes TaxID=299642 RepID=A0A8X6MHN0_NEPPI|nr:hypothetical protein NPIL_373431 [Nephila pilipes]
MYDEGFGTSNRRNWLSPSILEKRSVPVEENSQCNSKAFSQWNAEGLLYNLSHVFSKGCYIVGCIRLEPQMVVLTSELPVSLRPPQNNKEIETPIKRLLKANIIKPSLCCPLDMRKVEGKKTQMCIEN